MEYVYSAIQIICAHLIIYELGQLSTRRAGLATEDRVIASPKGFNIFQWGRIESFSLLCPGKEAITVGINMS